MKSDLCARAVDCNVTHQLNKLLPILKKFRRDLPLTAKTLLHTMHNMQCISRSGGDYMYFGVETGLESILCDKSSLLSVSGINAVELAFNINVVPLSVSSSHSL